MSSFRSIYDEHVGFVFRTLARLGVPDRSVPDGAQEVFTVAFRALPQFEGRSSVRTWLFGIARRVASDMRRSAPARRELLDDGRDDALTEKADSKADIAVWAERSEAVRRAEKLVRRLPEDQQLVFALFEIEDWSGAEIAEALEVPVATVHSRLRLARESLKRALRETEVAP